jgi:glycosyltransferase involved in cell wall biosynthesis
LGQKVKIIATVTNDLVNDQRMQRTCNSLSEEGYEVLLVGRKKAQSKNIKHQKFNQIRIKNWFNKGVLFYMEYNLRLFFFLLKNKADIIISVDLDTIVPGVCVKYLRRSKLVYDAHEYFSEVPEVVERKVVKRIWELIARFCIPKSDRAYTVGPILAQQFSKRYKMDFGVVRNCPETINHTMSKSSISPYLLYQGALNEGRCVELYIRMMHHLPMQLYIAGSGDLDADLRSLCQKEGLTNKVKFLGMLDPEELNEVTLNAFIGLNLLVDKGLSYHFSLANKSLDYIQAHVPSIHSKLPEYELINEEYDCFLFSETTENDLIEKIKLLQTNPELYQIKRKNCKIAAQKLNWQREKKELFRIYEGLA